MLVHEDEKAWSVLRESAPATSTNSSTSRLQMKSLLAVASALACGATVAQTVTFPTAIISATANVAQLQICDQPAQANQIREAVAESIRRSPYDFEQFYGKFEVDVRVIIRFDTPANNTTKEKYCSQVVDVSHSVSDVLLAKWPKAR